MVNENINWQNHSDKSGQSINWKSGKLSSEILEEEA